MTEWSYSKPFFEVWADRQGIPVIRDYAVEDLLKVPVGPWKRKGGKGALIILHGGQGWTSAYVCEIAPGETLIPQRQLFEEQIYVLNGQGESGFWYKEGERQVASWRKGSIFATPLNSWHVHRNTGSEPARYVAVTNAPVIFNIFANEDFVFSNLFAFRDRFRGESDYFSPEGKKDASMGLGTDLPLWRVNLIPDANAPKLAQTPMGTGMGLLQLNLASNTMSAHMAELEVGTYKKAHRHDPGPHIIWLSGCGYTFMWNERGEKIRIDWKPGGMETPPEGWFHQHFNTSPEPARHIAFRRGEYGTGKQFQPWLDVKKGGDQIEYEDEEPDVRTIYEEELRKAGIQFRMPAVRRNVSN